MQQCGISIANRHGRAKYGEKCAAAMRIRTHMRRPCRTDAMFRHRKRANWACRRHLVELLVEQRGWCGICLEPMRADEIETWAVSRIRPKWKGVRRSGATPVMFRTPH